MQFLWSCNTVTEVKHFKTQSVVPLDEDTEFFFNLRNLETFMETAICIIVNQNSIQFGMYFVSSTVYWKIAVTEVPKV